MAGGAHTPFLGAVTTTFTPPSECDLLTILPLSLDYGTSTAHYIYDPNFGTIGSKCYPLGPSSPYAQDYYSPGICPYRWTSYQATVTGSETRAICCPPNFNTYHWDGGLTDCKTTLTSGVTTTVLFGDVTHAQTNFRTVTDFVLDVTSVLHGNPVNIRYKAGDFASMPTSTTSIVPSSDQNPNPTASRLTPSVTSDNTPQTSRLDTGSIVGIAIGVPSLLVAAAALVFTIKQYKLKKHRRQSTI